MSWDKNILELRKVVHFNRAKIATGLFCFHICWRLNYLQQVDKDTVKPLLTGHECIPRGSDVYRIYSNKRPASNKRPPHPTHLPPTPTQT